MAVLMFGSKDSIIKKNLFVEFVYRDETVVVKDGEKFPRLGDWAQAEKINFSFCVSGDYDFKPNKKVPPTIDTSKFLLNQPYMGTHPFVVDTTEVSEDGKKIHCVVSDKDTIKGIGDWGCDWLLNNGLIPTPTEKPLKKYYIRALGDTKNFTMNIEDNKIEEGDQTVIFTANEGYEFQPNMTITGSTKITYSEGNTVITADIFVEDSVYYTVRIIKSVPKYAIEYDLTGCTTDSDKIANQGSRITIKLTADENHIFKTLPTVTGGIFTLNNDRTVATCTITVNQKISVGGVAEIPMFNVTYNLKGCVLDVGELSYKKGGTIIINLKSNEGTEFIDIPTMTMNGVITDFNVHTKKVSCDWVGTCTGEMVVNALSKKPKIYYTINENLTTVISDNTLTNIEENTEHTITYTTPSYNTLIEEYSSNIGSFTLSEDKTKLTLKFTATANINITVSAKIKSVVKITGDFQNCSCNYVDDEIYTGEKPILITADSGYTFKRFFNYKYGSVESSFVKISDTLIQAKPYEKDDDTIYLYDDYIATKEIEQVGTFVNLYKTNQTELTKLSKVRFSESSGQVTDYGSYINSLYILPFNIPSDILGDTSTILLGRLDSRVESTLIATYLFDIDGGSIEVPLKYDNIYDYVNTECILHLPFLDKVFLNSEYVIGQTLTITFTIELYSGNLTVNIVSSFNNEIVASVQGLIGMNIPFIQKSNGSVINSVSNVHKNMNKRCFVEVNRNIPYTKNNNVFGGSVVEYGKIGDYTGYLECDSLVLNTKATNQEQEEITNIIRNGVFI